MTSRWAVGRVLKNETGGHVAHPPATETLSLEGTAPLSTPFRLVLPRHCYDGMVAQAQAELPNECCGLLAGTVGADGVARVDRRYALVNEAPSPMTEFLSESKSLFAADRDRRRLGLEFL